MDYRQLSRLSKQSAEGLPRVRLAVLGDCATQHLCVALSGAARLSGMAFDMYEAPYDQILAQVIDPRSELNAFKPEYALIHMCSEKLHARFMRTPPDERAGFAGAELSDILRIWDGMSAQVLQFDFVEMDDGVFGSYALKTENSFTYQLRKLNMLLMDAARARGNVRLVALSAVQNRLGRRTFFDPKLYATARLAITLEAMPPAALAVVRVISATRGNIKKCAVLDLDGTLWGGVIGDDGLNGIHLGELGLGRAFGEFQCYLKELKNRGVILCVCSKNDEANAKQPFLEHPDMLLRLTDISVFIANWEDKAKNIRAIRDALDIGMDSMVFLDDNPFERELVRGMLPEITVPELPDDPAMYVEYLSELDLFETASFSKEDAERAGQYRAEAERRTLQSQYATFEDYLLGLDMRANFGAFDEFSVPRIAQLTQRSNQFNLRTIRYSEADIERIMSDDNYITLYFRLCDRFGDHGLISVVILKKLDNETLFIDTWLMSCRVLKRSMEEFIVNKMIDTAKSHGFSRIIGEYLRTPKNGMVADIYEKLGFERTGENEFEARTASFTYNHTFIQEA